MNILGCFTEPLHTWCTKIICHSNLSLSRLVKGKYRASTLTFCLFYKHVWRNGPTAGRHYYFLVCKSVENNFKRDTFLKSKWKSALRMMVETETNKWRIDTVITKSLNVYLCLTWQSPLLSSAIKGKWPSFIQLFCLQGFLSVPCRFTAHREGNFKESLGLFFPRRSHWNLGLLNDLQLQWVFVIGSISLDLLNLLWISSVYWLQCYNL